MLQGPRLGASASASAHPVPGQGEGPSLHGWRCRRRFAPAPPSAALEPPHPPLRHCRARCGRAGGRGRCCGGACAGAACADQEAGVFHRAVQGGDRPGLCLLPRHATPAPAQEALSPGAAPARLAVPWIVPSGFDAGLVQDRGEVNADMAEIQMGRDSDVVISFVLRCSDRVSFLCEWLKISAS